MSKGKAEKMESSKGILIVAQNKNARRNYEILETLEAGIQLKGSEVKSAREGAINLSDGYVKVDSGEAFLIGCHFSPYKFARKDQLAPIRERKLLLHKHELLQLDEKTKVKRLSVVPLKVYFKSGRCKVEIGVGRGKKLYDQREDVKKREAERAMKRVLNR